jgi:hypothetical protein
LRQTPAVLALGWRGSRVYVQWMTGVGKQQLGWLPATDSQADVTGEQRALQRRSVQD